MNAGAADRGTPLAAKLAGRIRQHGPISVADYMQACLHDPEHGYYRKSLAIGRGGDFITWETYPRAEARDHGIIL